jgi:acylphosphatase
VNGPTPSPARLEVRVSGRVQGVGFRFFAADRAVDGGLVGYARNLGDGGVEVVAEGSRPSLEEFLAALARGPRSAHVEQVEPRWSAPTGEFRDFGIRY